MGVNLPDSGTVWDDGRTRWDPPGCLLFGTRKQTTWDSHIARGNKKASRDTT